MKNKKEVILLIIFMLCLAASIILSFVPLEKACGGVSNGCYIVNTSQYETTLGIKNSNIGIAAFVMLIVFTLERRFYKKTKLNKSIITLGVIVGALFSIYFLYIQFFVLKLMCKYCMVIDLGMLISLGIILFWKEEKGLNNLKDVINDNEETN